MRIIKDHLPEYIHNLASAIGKDPASMENWRCMHISSRVDKPADEITAVIAGIKEIHGELDCDIVHCRDNDVFFISRSLQPMQMAEIAGELLHGVTPNGDQSAEMVNYDLFRDWQTVRQLLLSKVASSAQLASATPERSWFNFGEIQSLSEVFSDAKQARKARYPQHVLLVEDDPVTRRIVSNCLKEKYALISAGTAEDALANYLIYAPDVVFLDIGLPDVSGLDVLHQIMKTDPEAYVVMFSGNSYLDNVTLALGHGAAGFIAKPFKKEKMLHYIHASAQHHSKSA